MKCYKCGKKMEPGKNLKFNQYLLDGWKCSCGEQYYNPEQAQKILLINKLKKARIKTKLGQIRSNLILRLPKDIEVALGLRKGEEVELRIEKDGLKVLVA